MAITSPRSLLIGLTVRLPLYAALLLLTELTFRLPLMRIVFGRWWAIALAVVAIVYLAVTRIDSEIMRKVWASRRAMLTALWMIAAYWALILVEWLNAVDDPLFHETFIPYAARMILVGFPSSLFGLLEGLISAQVEGNFLDGMSMYSHVLYAWGVYAIPAFVQLWIIWKFWKRKHPPLSK